MAQGQLSWASARHVITLWAQGRSGLQARLCWAAREAADHQDRMERRAEMQIRWAVRPLFAANATTAQIEEAAGNVRGPLDWSDVIPILREELQRHRAQRK